MSNSDIMKLRQAAADYFSDSEAPNMDSESTNTMKNDETFLEGLRQMEALLFASPAPITAAHLHEVLPEGFDVADGLMTLQAHYSGRGIELMEIGGKWRFQTAGDLAGLFEKDRYVVRKPSQAALETLAIISYCQPVTRAEIEDVRGVAVSKGTLDTLMEAGWIKIKGRRHTPGRPVTYGTTEAFLQHFGLKSIDHLPGKGELKASGFLSSNIPDEFEIPSFSAEEEVNQNNMEFETDMESEEREFHTDFLGQEATG